MRFPTLVVILLALATATNPASVPTPIQTTITATASLTPPTLMFSHILIILMENHGISQICGASITTCNNPNAPYMSKLANTYGLARQYTSLTHPSLPNYLALLGGDTFGCTTDSCSPVSNPNLVDELERSGFTWRAYMEGYSGGCSGDNLGLYSPGHNPFIHFNDILNNTTRCARIVNPGIGDGLLLRDLNSSNLAPNYMWLTPDLCNDMHDTCGGQPQTGDNYLSVLVPQILNSTLFRMTNSALFITFDEGNNYCPLNNTGENCLYTVWAGPTAKKEYASNLFHSHYSLLSTIEKEWSLRPLTKNDQKATLMTELLNPLSPDLNGDGIVNIEDLVLEVTAMGTNSNMSSYVSRYDLNQDNVINIQDLEIVVLNFGTRLQSNN